MTLSELKKKLEADAVSITVNELGYVCFLHYGDKCYNGFGSDEKSAVVEALESYKKSIARKAS